MTNVVSAQAAVPPGDRRENHRTDGGDRGRDDLRQDRNPDAVVLCPASPDQLDVRGKEW